MAFRYILVSFGNFVVVLYIFPVLVHCVKKNLATLVLSTLHQNETNAAVPILSHYVSPSCLLQFIERSFVILFIYPRRSVPQHVEQLVCVYVLHM
jgi:hypothetical protein